jgi:lactate dehydrogenase-like 2-hydroxyacid dehydrogenase
MRVQRILMAEIAYLINTARGGVDDETAPIPALRESRLRGAALDVFTANPG